MSEEIPTASKHKYQEYYDNIYKDPFINVDLIHPETPVLKHRLTSNSIIQGYYRPDLKKGSKTPTKEEVMMEFEAIIQDFDKNVIWRTARTEKIFHTWRSKADLELVHDVCTALFTKMNSLPYDPTEQRPTKDFFTLEAERHMKRVVLT